jgi:hypothetical protein
MSYRETMHYVVLCDHCGLAAPEGTDCTTPTLADEAALEAGWEMTATEHLCPGCAVALATTGSDGSGGAGPDRPAIQPSNATPPRHPDVSGSRAVTARPRSWEESR